jgi:hypothetical protein
VFLESDKILSEILIFLKILLKKSTLRIERFHSNPHSASIRAWFECKLKKEMSDENAERITAELRGHECVDDGAGERECLDF